MGRSSRSGLLPLLFVDMPIGRIREEQPISRVKTPSGACHGHTLQIDSLKSVALGRLVAVDWRQKPGSRTGRHFACFCGRALANLESPDRSNGRKSSGNRRDEQPSHRRRAGSADH